MWAFFVINEDKRVKFAIKKRLNFIILKKRGAILLLLLVHRYLGVSLLDLRMGNGNGGPS